MKNARAVTLCLTLALFGAGCGDEEISPAPSPVLQGPELSQPRQPRKTADAPTPIRQPRDSVDDGQMQAPDPAPNTPAH